MHHLSDSYRVSFSGNIAGGKYQSIFVGNPYACIDNSSKSILLNQTKIFHYVPDYKAQITSSEISVTLYDKDMSRLVEVMLGERFYLYPTVIDAFNSNAFIPGYNIQLSDDESFSFGGHQDRSINEWNNE